MMLFRFVCFLSHTAQSEPISVLIVTPPQFVMPRQKNGILEWTIDSFSDFLRVIFISASSSPTSTSKITKTTPLLPSVIIHIIAEYGIGTRLLIVLQCESISPSFTAVVKSPESSSSPRVPFAAKLRIYLFNPYATTNEEDHIRTGAWYAMELKHILNVTNSNGTLPTPVARDPSSSLFLPPVLRREIDYGVYEITMIDVDGRVWEITFNINSEDNNDNNEEMKKKVGGSGGVTTITPSSKAMAPIASMRHITPSDSKIIPNYNGGLPYAHHPRQNLSTCGIVYMNDTDAIHVIGAGVPNYPAGIPQYGLSPAIHHAWITNDISIPLDLPIPPSAVSSSTEKPQQQHGPRRRWVNPFDQAALPVGDSAVSRHRAAIVHYTDMIVLIGGFQTLSYKHSEAQDYIYDNNTKVLTSSECYDRTTQRWSNLPYPLNFPRYDAHAVVVNNTIMILVTRFTNHYLLVISHWIVT
jgi:hypothetical protein